MCLLFSGFACEERGNHGICVQSAPTGRPYDAGAFPGDQQEASGCTGGHTAQEHDPQGEPRSLELTRT